MPTDHYPPVYTVCARWSEDGSLAQAVITRVAPLAAHPQRDLSVLHGDGTNTVAKTGGGGSDSSGHKPQQGEKVIAILDTNGYVLAPLPMAPVHTAETVLFPQGVQALKRVARLTGLALDGAYLTLEGGCDSRPTRTAICNAGRIPHITANLCHRQPPTRGRQRLCNEAIHALRARVERTCAWEKKCTRVLLRFAYIQQRHYGIQWMAYT